MESALSWTVTVAQTEGKAEAWVTVEKSEGGFVVTVTELEKGKGDRDREWRSVWVSASGLRRLVRGVAWLLEVGEEER